MLKALLIDDELKARQSLARLIGSYVPEITDVRQASSAEAALPLIASFRPELLFLDILMPGMGGFELLNALPKWEFDVIFTTAHDHFAIQAIRFSALDYLLKPIDPEELQEAVQRHLSRRHRISEGRLGEGHEHTGQLQILLQNLKTGSSSSLAVSTSEGIHVLNFEDIVRCEADRNYTLFHLLGKRALLVSKTLKEFDELLAGKGFLRIHKSHLVNMKFVERLSGRGLLYLKDGTELEVAKRRKATVLEMIQQY